MSDSFSKKRESSANLEAPDRSDAGLARRQTVLQPPPTHSQAALFPAIMDQLETGVMIFRVDDTKSAKTLTLVYCNPAARHAFGVFSEKPGAMPGAFPHSWTTKILESYRKAAVTGKRLDVIDMLSSGEPVREALASARIMALPDPYVAIEFRASEPAREGMQAALQREKEFSERLINSMVEGVFAFDRECRYTLWNPAMERIFGLKREEVLGQCAFDVLPFLKQTGEDRFFFQALQGKCAVSWERRHRVHGTGHEVLFDGYYSPILDTTGSTVGKGKVIGGLGMLHDITERKQAQESLRSLSSRILTLQDEERRRIARELHDVTAQTLYALALNLDMVEKRLKTGDPQVAAALKESRALASSVSQDVRNLSHLLHPPDLDTIGLIPAMHWYAVRFTERTGVRVAFDVRGEIGRLSREFELALFRVFQESLTNVHRHSGSDLAEVRVETDGKELKLRVTDHGRGLASRAVDRGHEPVKSGIGIENMKARMRHLGGHLEIDFTKTGTAVTATAPLGAAAATGEIP